jgi:regulator of protease activity HflC (stomatin/prohibitin superfamily)
MNFETVDINAAAGARLRVLLAAAERTDNETIRQGWLDEAARLLNAVPGAAGTTNRLTANESD